MTFSIEQNQLTVLQSQMIKNSHVVFCTPCYGGMISYNAYLAMLDIGYFWGRCGMKWSVETLSNESLVTRARNSLVARMMANEGATHLMFIDADIGFKIPDIIRLLSHDVDVVAGLYPKKNYPIEYAMNPLHDQVPDDAEIVEVTNIGTGFMLIKRSVFETMMEAYPQYHCPKLSDLPEVFERFAYTFFDTEVVDGCYLSEDYAFCRRWREIGGQVFADTRIKLTHVGAHTFAGDPREHLVFEG